MPRTTVYTALELALLSLLAIQGARLAWTIFAPVDPVGDWRTADSLRRVAPAAPVGFDPFFRLVGGGTAVVTALNLKLFGVREDRASGRGSAIVALPDGTQRSFAVGEEIMPGVKLSAVGFDSITIDRAGTPEQLFLDQSTPATDATPPAPAPTAASTTQIFATPEPAPPPPSPAANQIQYQPRLEGGKVTGVTVNPQGNGEAFRAAGLQPGDVIVSVNGQRVTGAEQARALANQVRDSQVSVEVERGGQNVPLTVRAPQ
ncbi:type II secretion system protein N [Allosphingosinicella indica]|uniref:type II secretion system protein N n=1 Tax=Allosphingosinicella indica TaxID=941907 RepID=UPI003139BD26